MIKRLLLLCLFVCAVAVAQPPTITNVYTPTAANGQLGHGDFLATWDLSAAASCHRVQYGLTSAYGSMQTVTGNGQLGVGIPIGGLNANTPYHYAPQSSFDCTTWSTAVDHVITTLPLPAVHPEPARTDAIWEPTALPSTAGGQTVTLDSTCTQVSPNAGRTFMQTMNDMITFQASTTAFLVLIPPQATCPGDVQLIDDPQLMTMPADSTHVNTTTGVFTPAVIPSGFNFVNGQSIKFIANVCLPDSQTHGRDGYPLVPGMPCFFEGQITNGQKYYLVNVTTSPNTFQVSATLGGPPIIPGDVGVFQVSIQQDPPQHSHPIVVRSSVSDNTFCVMGTVCYGSIWASKMWKLTAPGGGHFSHFGIKGGLGVHDIYFDGIELTHADMSSVAATTIDPQDTRQLMYFPYSWGATRIGISRSYIHGLGFPNRLGDVLANFGGEFMYLRDSDLRNLSYWRPSVTPYSVTGSMGLACGVSSNVITCTPGTAYAGAVNVCTATANWGWTITGGTANGNSFSNGTPYGYVVRIDPDCTPTLEIQTGMTATASGSMTDKNSVSHSSRVTNSSSPYWNLDVNGGFNSVTIAAGPLASGVATSIASLGSFPLSQWVAEGTQSIQLGQGPGPVTMSTLWVDAPGLSMHQDDGGTLNVKGWYLRRIMLDYREDLRLGSSTTDHHRYGERNGPEGKRAEQVWIDGCICRNAWADISRSSPCFLFHTAANSGTQPPSQTFFLSDIKFTNNLGLNVVTMLEVGGGVYNVQPAWPAARRIEITNNFVTTDGWRRFDWSSGQVTQDPVNPQVSGNPWIFDGAITDLRRTHNTTDGRGSDPTTHWNINVPIEGILDRDNVTFVNGLNYVDDGEGGNVSLVPSITGSAKALLDSVGQPSYIHTNNLMIPYFADSKTPAGTIDPTNPCVNYGGAYSAPTCTGGINPLMTTQSTTALRLAAVKYVGGGVFTPFANFIPPNFNMRYDSPYVGMGSDGKPMGADMWAIMRAEGRVGEPSVTNITATGAKVSFYVYDETMAVVVDIATDPNDPSSQTGGFRCTGTVGHQQSVTFGTCSGALAPHTRYRGRVYGAIFQPEFSFSTP